MRTRKRELLGILSISLMILTINSLAGTWRDDFDDGRAEGWSEVSGKWEVKDGIYQQTDMVTEYQKTIHEVGDWMDYTLEVDVTILEGGPGSTSVAAGVLLRTNETGSSGYRLWIRADQYGFQLSVWMDDAYTHVITNAAERAELGETYRLKVQIEGSSISAWVDDRLMFEDHVDEEGLFPSGRIGLINYNAHCQYDNLTVSGENVISNLAVAPDWKVAATWGATKKTR